MTNFRDDSHSDSKISEKALTKALRRLPTGGWDSRSSRQSLSALFSSPHNHEVSLQYREKADGTRVDRRKVAKFTELAMALPDVRAKRIAELKSRINAGEYEVDSLEVAKRIIEE